MPSEEPIYSALPVAGYTEQPQSAIDMVNENKQDEEILLRYLDELKDDVSIDQRWLAIGRTHIEQGFMCINRAIFKPQRLALPDNEK